MKPARSPQPSPHPKPASVELDSRAEDLASAMAPIIFSDCVAAYGRSGATTWLTLTACRHLLRGDQGVIDAPAVAFLRLTPEAAQQLRQALEVLDLKAADTTGAAH